MILLQISRYLTLANFPMSAHRLWIQFQILVIGSQASRPDPCASGVRGAQGTPAAAEMHPCESRRGAQGTLLFVALVYEVGPWSQKTSINSLFQILK